MLDKMNATTEHVKDEADLPEWAQYKGEGPTPKYWWAENPDTKQRTKVYRSFADYCDD